MFHALHRRMLDDKHAKHMKNFVAMQVHFWQPLPLIYAISPILMCSLLRIELCSLQYHIAGNFHIFRMRVLHAKIKTTKVSTIKIFAWTLTSLHAVKIEYRQLDRGVDLALWDHSWCQSNIQWCQTWNFWCQGLLINFTLAKCLTRYYTFSNG